MKMNPYADVDTRQGVMRVGRTVVRFSESGETEAERVVDMTNRQRRLLREIRSGRSLVSGPDVGVARRLEALGLALLTDNGELRLSGRSDGERWTVSLTDAGRLVSGAS